MRILCIGVSGHIAVRTIMCLVHCIQYLVFVQIVTAASFCLFFFMFRVWRILCVWWGTSPTSCTLSFLPQSDFVWRAQQEPLLSGTVTPLAALLCTTKRALRWDSLNTVTDYFIFCLSTVLPSRLKSRIFTHSHSILTMALISGRVGRLRICDKPTLLT